MKWRQFLKFRHPLPYVLCFFESRGLSRIAIDLCERESFVSNEFKTPVLCLILTHGNILSSMVSRPILVIFRLVASIGFLGVSFTV